MQNAFEIEMAQGRKAAARAKKNTRNEIAGEDKENVHTDDAAPREGNQRAWRAVPNPGGKHVVQEDKRYGYCAKTIELRNITQLSSHSGSVAFFV